MKFSQLKAESLAIALAVIGVGTISLAQIILGDRLYVAFDRVMGRQTIHGLFPTTNNSFNPVSLQTQAQSPSPESKPSTPRRLVFNLNISSPKDLKVKERDAVAAGQVVAERVEEQAMLRSQRSALQMEYRQIQDRLISTPQPPVRVPAINRLPPISYAEEEAAIARARLNIRQMERAYQLQQQNLVKPPIEEAAKAKRAAVTVQNQQRIVNNQHRKIDAVAMLKDLPDSVMPHELEVLKQKEAELQQTVADHEQALALLKAAQNAQTEKSVQLGAALEVAKAEYSVALAKLQTKKDQRAYTEYEASITAARAVEEQNQAAQSYSRTLTEAFQQQRDRTYALAQLQGRMSELDDKLKNLSVVTSPYTGVIRKIKILRQNDTQLSAELTLDITAPDAPKPSPNKPPTPAPSTSPNNTITKQSPGSSPNPSVAKL